MRQQLTVKGGLEIEEVRKWLQRPLARLRRRLMRFPGDAVHLRTLVREMEGRGRAAVALTLRLPSNTLAVSEEGPHARAALGEAFGELDRLLEKEKSRLRRAESWRRSRDAFRRELVARVTQQAQPLGSALAADALLPQVRELERFVERELRWLEASGELVSGEVDPRDVVDTAFCRAFARRGGRPSRSDLLHSATSALRSELARARAARQELHIEDEVAELSPAEMVSTLGSEVLDFHQTDDPGLWVEDLIPGLGRTPEELEATAELAEIVEKALAVLPARWRQAYQLRQLEDLDDLSIARTLGVETHEVPRLLEHTTAFLRERLDEALASPAGT